MAKKIRFITELYYPETVSTSFILTQIAEGLVNDFDVSVICTTSSYDESNNIDTLNEVRNGVKIHRIRVLKLNKNQLFQRFLKQVIISLKLFYHLLSKVKDDEIIFIVTNPPILIPLVVMYKLIRKNKIILLVHDVFPDNMVAASLMRVKSLLYRFACKVYQFCLHKSDIVVVIGRDMKELIDKKIGHSKSIVIPNWSEHKKVYPLPREKNPILEQYSISGKFVILFAGNLGRLQAIDVVLKVAEQIDDNDIHFLFIGGGAMEKVISDFIDKNHKKNVTLLPSFQRKHQNEFINAGDIGLISLNAGMYGLGVPSKTYNILAVGKPIFYIGDENSEVDLIIKEHNVGWSSSTNNIENIIYLLKEAKRDLFFNKKKEKARLLAETQFSYDSVIAKFKYIFDNLV